MEKGLEGEKHGCRQSRKGGHRAHPWVLMGSGYFRNWGNYVMPFTEMERTEGGPGLPGKLKSPFFERVQFLLSFPCVCIIQEDLSSRELGP